MIHTSSVEKNKTLYRRFIQEVLNEGSVESLYELLSPDYIYRDAPVGSPNNRESILEIGKMFRKAFPDLKITLDELIGEGEFLAARGTTQGTHQGPIFGIPATGKKITMNGMTMVRIVNSQIVESWVKNDILGLMNQLEVNTNRG